MKFCIQCGAEIDDSAKFCPICGAPVVDEDETRSPIDPLPVKLDPLYTSNEESHFPKHKSTPKWLPILCGALSLIFLWPVLFGRGGPSKTPAEQAEEYYKKAQSEYTLDNYQQALSYLEDAIKADPDYTPAIELREEILPLRAAQYLYAAKEYQEKGDYLSAQTQLHMALELDPGNTEAAGLLPTLEPLAAEQQLRKKEEEAAAEEARQAEVTPSPGTGNVNLFAGMDESERRKINTFLSNFSEQGSFSHYDAQDYEVEEVIDFAFLQNLLNNPGAVVYSDSGACIIPVTNIESTIRRFFDLSITPQSTQLLAYDNSEFVYWGRDVTIHFLSIADTMFVNQDGNYTVAFTVYSVDPSVSVSDIYGYTSNQIISTGAFDAAGSGTATIKQFNYNGKEEYCLLKYDMSLNEGALDNPSIPDDGIQESDFDSTIYHSGSELFYEKQAAEQSTLSLSLSELIRNPMLYANGTLYRFTGVVDNITRDTSLSYGLLKIYGLDSLVAFKAPGWIDSIVGDEILFYGYVDSNPATYTVSDYQTGQIRSVQTANIEIKYCETAPQKSLSNLEEYEWDMICGTYQLNEATSNPPQEFETTLEITQSTINGRPYTIKNIQVAFNYDMEINSSRGEQIYINFATTNANGENFEGGLSFYLTGKLFYVGAQESYVDYKIDKGSYYKVS